MNRQALDGFEKTAGKEHVKTIKSVNNRAILLHYQGKLEEAERMFRQVIEVKEKELGKGHRDMLSSVWWLAHVNEQQSRLEEAYELYHRALNGYKAFGPDDSDLKHIKQAIVSFGSCFTRREGCWIRNQ
ncbi:TPR domain protein (kinesin light chain) [Colletotrichum graminicola]|nr:TPR domain protein (kinesin light chain) [Colletotrichum graminicola]